MIWKLTCIRRICANECIIWMKSTRDQDRWLFILKIYISFKFRPRHLTYLTLTRNESLTFFCILYASFRHWIKVNQSFKLNDMETLYSTRPYMIIFGIKSIFIITECNLNLPLATQSFHFDHCWTCTGRSRKCNDLCIHLRIWTWRHRSQWILDTFWPGHSQPWGWLRIATEIVE